MKFKEKLLRKGLEEDGKGGGERWWS